MKLNIDMQIGNDEDEFAIYYPTDPRSQKVMVWLWAYPPILTDRKGELPDRITVEIEDA